MASLIQTIWAVSLMNIKSITQRLWSSLTAILGIAVVVAVMIAFLSMAEGFDRTVKGTGSDAYAIALRDGSQAEINSVVSQEQVNILAEAPGVARRDGTPLVSPELYVIVDGIKKSTGQSVNLPMRGIDSRGLLLRDNIEIIEGRAFTEGRNEIIVGRGAQDQFRGLEVGNTVRFGKTEWEVVGLFTAAGGISESELWADTRIVQSLFQRGSSYQSLRLALETPGDTSAIEAYIEADPRLNLDIKTEADYLAGQASQLSTFIRYVGYPLSVVMMLGALAGALNTMYTAVSSRIREIATLRTIGFGGLATFIGFLVEALVLSFLGGILGIVAAWLFFDGLTASTLGQSFTQVVFDLEVTASLAQEGLVFALIVGFIGGAFPALRAARLPLVAAFRS